MHVDKAFEKMWQKYWRQAKKFAPLENVPKHISDKLAPVKYSKRKNRNLKKNIKFAFFSGWVACTLYVNGDI